MHIGFLVIYNIKREFNNLILYTGGSTDQLEKPIILKMSTLTITDGYLVSGQKI